MFGSSRVARKAGASSGATRPRYPGEDSEFYLLEKALPGRASGETHAAWIQRIASDFQAQEFQKLREALRLHQRYRFDPQGISPAERSQLRQLCAFLAPGGRRA